MSSGAPLGEYDVVVVGGGHNGLVAGAYLAKSGLTTAVLERRHIVGMHSSEYKWVQDKPKCFKSMYLQPGFEKNLYLDPTLFLFV